MWRMRMKFYLGKIMSLFIFLIIYISAVFATPSSIDRTEDSTNPPTLIKDFSNGFPDSLSPENAYVRIQQVENVDEHNTVVYAQIFYAGSLDRLINGKNTIDEEYKSGDRKGEWLPIRFKLNYGKNSEQDLPYQVTAAAYKLKPLPYLSLNLLERLWERSEEISGAVNGLNWASTHWDKD